MPLNESWGVRKILSDRDQQNYARALYYLTKAIDGSRLISTNDGWENVDTTDVVSVSYTHLDVYKRQARLSSLTV